MTAEVCSKGVEKESCLMYRMGKCCDAEQMKKMKQRCKKDGS